jgi:hypothetical protein
MPRICASRMCIQAAGCPYRRQREKRRSSQLSPEIPPRDTSRQRRAAACALARLARCAVACEKEFQPGAPAAAYNFA